MIQDHLDSILDHIETEYPREACGVIGVSKGKSNWFPCQNVSENDLEFVIDSKDYMNASLRSDLVAVVHSHPDMSEEPSHKDITQCNHSKLDYYIFSWPKLAMYHLEPKREKIPLIGRSYEWGYLDCWKIVQDYYKEELGITLETSNLTDFTTLTGYTKEWWEKGLNYFMDLSEDYGFEEVTDGSLEKNDGLLFSIRSEVPNHCGVYLGNDLILHHAENRLSCRESLYPFWGKHKTHTMRYTKCRM